MDGSINPSEVATLSLLGGGGGYGYGGVHGREFATDGSNAVRINSGSKLASQAHDFISQQISDNADRNRDTLSTLQTNTSFDRVNDKIADQTDFFNSAINGIMREQNQNAREAAKCCCEAQLLAVQNQAKTDAGLAQILANQSCDTRVADAVASAQQNAKLDALLSERGRGQGNG
jgi:hypothetical protein